MTLASPIPKFVRRTLMVAFALLGVSVLFTPEVWELGQDPLPRRTIAGLCWLVAVLAAAGKPMASRAWGYALVPLSLLACLSYLQADKHPALGAATAAISITTVAFLALGRTRPGWRW